MKKLSGLSQFSLYCIADWWLFHCHSWHPTTTVFDMKIRRVAQVRCLWFMACFELRFSRQWILSLRSSGVWHRVVSWNCSGVSELPAAFIFSLGPVFQTAWHHNRSDDRCSNPGHLVALGTKFFTVAPNIFSVIFAVTVHYIQKCVPVQVQFT
jgi:hypothetical protein